jgi:2-dehydro-3-deoxygluconokinase
MRSSVSGVDGQDEDIRSVTGPTAEDAQVAPDLVTVGETMALLTPPSVGPLRHATSLSLSIAGAESNVAIGASRLGGTVAWIGRVGDDEFGRLITGTLRSEGVHVAAITDPESATALMFKERRSSGLTRVSYYRRELAGSRLEPDDLPLELIREAHVLHVTGITAGLSDSARAAVELAVKVARSAGTVISLDLNYRSALWTQAAAAPVLRALAENSDVLFATDQEAGLLVGSATQDVLLQRLADLGPAKVLIKRGAEGAVALLDGTEHMCPAVAVEAVDPVGAGDGFVAGYLTGLVEGQDPDAALRRGALAGAFAVTVDGDWQGLPTLRELDDLGRPSGDVTR